MDYQMEHSNECKKNFVAVYDGSSAIENLKAKFCSTVANDVMLDNGVGVVRMWADEKSRLSRFRMLFTSFVDRECQSFWRHLTQPGCLRIDHYEESCPVLKHYSSVWFFYPHASIDRGRSGFMSLLLLFDLNVLVGSMKIAERQSSKFQLLKDHLFSTCKLAHC